MQANDTVKFFTVEDANRTLPLVSRIVADIVEEGALVETLLARLEKEHSARPRRRASDAADKNRVPDENSIESSLAAALADVSSAQADELREQVARATARLENYLKELNALGCVFKGPEGLVDFYSMMDGRPVFLCWKLGEEEIQYWHEIDAGFDGREPLISGSVPSSELGYGREG